MGGTEAGGAWPDRARMATGAEAVDRAHTGYDSDGAHAREQRRLRHPLHRGRAFRIECGCLRDRNPWTAAPGRRAGLLGRGGAAEAVSGQPSGNLGVFRAMKSIAVMVLIIVASICLLSGSSRAQQLPATAQPLTGEKKVLIVYLSRTNNTKAIAEFIHRKVGGTIVPLELEKPYPADYDATVPQVAQENE